MLLEVNIKNFALIKQLNIKFNNGLNVLMGETGAGKSNIIDALGVLMGGRASKDSINNDSESAHIYAAFNVENNDIIKNILSKEGIIIEDEPLIISRDISRKSSSISKINGNMVPISLLKIISAHLIDIYGQFDNNLILSRIEQRKFIDRLGSQDYKKLLHAYEEQYKVYQDKVAELTTLTKSPEDIARHMDILKFQIEEIEKSKVLELDEETIESRLLVLENMQMLVDATEEVDQYLDGEGDLSILNALSKITSLSSKITNVDLEFSNLDERLKQVYIDLKDIRFEVSNYLNSLSYDGEELYKLDKQRGDIFSMKRKYGKDIADILNFYEKSKFDLQELQNYETSISILKQEIEFLKTNLYDQALLISKGRNEIVEILEKDLSNEFIELEMNDTTFKVDINEQEMSQSGIDDIAFMISFNRNQPLKEFSTVASGGEISRFMLAIKSIEANYDMTPTIIFDEIDTGISGNAGKVVAKKLKKLSELHQLISISHLPQIISRADYQYLVYKDESDLGIESHIKLLNHNERIIQLAMVIEGNDYSANTLETAKNMIEDGR